MFATRRIASPAQPARVVVLVLPGSDFSAPAESLAEFRGEFEAIARARTQSDAARAASQR